jgi:hypothetical protein
MKALKPLAPFFIFLLAFSSSNGQSNLDNPSHRALVYADSLLNAFRNNELNQYIDMSYPGIISYYGGKKNFQDYIERERTVITSDNESTPEKIELMQIQKEKDEWQCVIKKTTKTNIDGKKAFIISYLVGQSTDEGQTWKYFDVAINSVENIGYIMPDIFNTLSIPQRQVIFEKDQVAVTQ